MCVDKLKMVVQDLGSEEAANSWQREICELDQDRKYRLASNLHLYSAHDCLSQLNDIVNINPFMLRQPRVVSSDWHTRSETLVRNT
jgi:hypothetical protein